MRGVNISNAPIGFARNIDLHRQHSQVMEPYVQPRRPHRILTFADESYASCSDAAKPSALLGQNQPTSPTRYLWLELRTITNRPRAARAWLSSTYVPQYPVPSSTLIFGTATEITRVITTVPGSRKMKCRFSWTVTECGVRTSAKISWASPGCNA